MVRHPASRIAFSLAALVLTAAPLLAGDCPDVEVRLSSSSDAYQDPRASLDSTRTDSEFTSRVHYDLASGIIGLSATPADGEEVSVKASDEFELIGLPSGSEVTIDVLLEFEGSIGTPGCSGPGCGASFFAVLFDESHNYQREVEAPVSSGETQASDAVPLSTRFTVGTGKRIFFWFVLNVLPGANHGGEWSGRLRFVGLPSGASIVSCSGYGGTTASRPATWGTIKSRYR